MLWSCSNCSTTDISGKYRNCPNCNQPHSAGDPDEVYYVDPTPEVVSRTSEGEPIPERLPHKNCPRCEEVNEYEEPVCTKCGAEFDSSTFTNSVIRYEDDALTVTPGESDTFVSRAQDELDATWAVNVVDSGDKQPPIQRFVRRMSDLPRVGPMVARVRAYVHERDEYVSRRRTQIVSAIIAAIAVVLAVIVITTVAFVFRKQPGTITVQELRWSRSIEIEVYQTDHRAAWYRPSEGRVTDVRYEVSGHHSEFDHYETENYTDREYQYVGQESYQDCDTDAVNNGDGTITYERSCSTESRSVYDWVNVPKQRTVEVTRQVADWDYRYYYDIDVWMHQDIVTAQGVNSEPTDPALPQLNTGNFPSLDEIGDQRTLTPSTTLTVVYCDKKGCDNRKNVSFSTWSQLKPGDTVNATYRRKFVTNIEWPSAA
jgi:hypothetical protein